MSIRLVLVPLGMEGVEALPLAVQVAARFEAGLTGLLVRADPREAMHLSEGLPGGMVEALLDAAEAEAGRREAAARAAFAAATSALPAERTRFTVQTGRAAESLARAARVADVTVMGRPARQIDAAEALHAVLFESGRPVLLAPEAALLPARPHVALAWSGTAEAAAALAASLPFLQAARQVSVLWAKEYRRPGPEAAEVVEYLAAHGVGAAPQMFAPVDQSIGAGLLAAAGALGAEMLAMGAYSSSRLRQLILGGTTRHVLENAALPVLMCR